MPDARSVLAIVAAALFAAAAVYVWQSGRDEVYESTTLLAVDAPATLAAAGGRPENIVFLARTTAARARIGPVVEDAVGRSDLDLTPAEARQRLDVTVSNQDATISIRAQGPSGEAAQALASALAAALGDHVRAEQASVREERLSPLVARIEALEGELSELPPDSTQRAAAEREYQALVAERATVQVEPYDRLQVLSPADVPSESVSPRPRRDALIAFIIALVIGIEWLIGSRLYRQHQARTREPAAEV